MKSLVTLLLLMLPAFAWAQTDTLLYKADTLTGASTRKLDSLQHSFTFKADSIKQAYTGKTEKLLSLRQKYVQKLDSLRARRTAAPGNPLDTLKTPALSVPADVNVYTKKIDSVDQQLKRVQQQTTAKLDSLKGKVNAHLGKLQLPKEADEKVAGLTAAMDKVNVPAFNTDMTSKMGINALPTGMPALPVAKNIPSINLPNANLPSVNVDVPDLDLKTPDLKGNIPSTGLTTGKIGDVSSQIENVSGQAGEIQKQVTEATGSAEGLGKTLEGKAAEHVPGLPDKTFPDVAGLPGGVPQTGDAAKQQLADLAKKEAVNHFAGKEAALTSAIDKMSKYKQKYSSVSSLKDIKDEKHHNEMKGKPLRERLVPALTLQFQSWQDVMLDINPSIGYRVTSHFTTGMGWNQRIAFNIPQTQFNQEAKVYGVRTYGEYTFKKGFGFRLDVESMNAPAKENHPGSDLTPPRDWIWGMLVGIKQKYPVYKKLKGNAQVMYNIFDKDHRSPYLDRVNFRMGLEFTLKKKKKAS